MPVPDYLRFFFEPLEPKNFRKVATHSGVLEILDNEYNSVKLIPGTKMVKVGVRDMKTGEMEYREINLQDALFEHIDNRLIEAVNYLNLHVVIKFVNFAT
jgi:hypothetical protein